MWRIARDRLRLLVFTVALASSALGIPKIAVAQDEAAPFLDRMTNRMRGASSDEERAARADDIAIFSRYIDDAHGSLDEAPVVISEIAARARTESSARARLARVDDLAWIARFFAQSDRLGSIDQSTIASLSLLLNDESEGVVATVAAALGWLGPRAASAVPALEAALRRSEASRQPYLIAPAQDYTHVIESALERITGQNRAIPSK